MSKAWRNSIEVRAPRSGNRFAKFGRLSPEARRDTLAVNDNPCPPLQPGSGRNTGNRSLPRGVQSTGGAAFPRSARTLRAAAISVSQLGSTWPSPGHAADYPWNLHCLVSAARERSRDYRSQTCSPEGCTPADRTLTQGLWAGFGLRLPVISVPVAASGSVGTWLGHPTTDRISIVRSLATRRHFILA